MEFKPGHTVGIDLGTTFSTLAILDENGDPVPIANDDDEVETPSLILLAESGHVVVGPARMRAAVEDPAERHRPRQAVHGQCRLQANVRRPRDHARVPVGLDSQKVAPGRGEADRQDRQRRDHGPLLLQRSPPQGDRRRRPHRRPERGRSAQRTDRRHADLRLGTGRAGRRRKARTLVRTRRWSTIWAAARST